MFTHLHTHSDYSFLDALPKVKDLAKAAAKNGMKAVALTDRSNMHGALEFYKACKGEGVLPILGLECFVAPRSRHDKEPGIDAKRSRIVLIAKNNTGYENLLELSTLSFTEGFYYVARVDTEILEKFSSDIFCILPRAGGEMTPFLEMGDFENAEKVFAKFEKIFGKENIFLETTPRPNNENEGNFQKNFHLFCQKNGVKGVATNDVRYILADEADVHDTLLCMEYSLQKSDKDRISVVQHDASFWTEEQMREYFLENQDVVDNTEKIAEVCHYEFEFGKNRIPHFEIPENFASDTEYLRFMCEQGLQKRYENPTPEKMEEVKNRLDFELKVIDGMGFNSYFLIVADFVQWAKNNGIAVGPGRGSAAGAIVAYLLEITDLDPLDYGLYFERFLNPERVSMPDIDIDFSDVRREEVLNYVRDKYGRDRVVQICTFGTMAARAAVKDVGRVFGIPFSEMNEFAKLIPEKPGTTLDDAIEQSSELREVLAKNEEMKKLFETAQKLEGNVRHISVHACAVIIAPEKIVKYTAIQPAPKDPTAIITQFEAKPLDMLGLLKMDFLGLRNLTILEKTLENIKNRHGVEIDIKKISMTDEKAFKLLQEGLTTGVFQLESAGMTRYLKELKPTRFEDLIAMVSLYRPGPMKFIPEYIDGKHGKKKIAYPHPSLEKVLSETFGIAVYQEQILEIAKIFGGFSLGGADLLRRAIGKKIASELAAQRKKFIDGAMELGHAESLAVKIFDDVIEPFAGYGFNKSHAACYAMISYQTAFLKAHYPVEFLAALMSCDEENTDRVILDIEEARKMGMEVLPPDVNESESSFHVIDEKTIRFGLNAIKGIGESVVEKILEAKKSGNFINFVDFLEKCGSKAINKKSLESLGKAGALKKFEKTENILGNIEKILEFTKNQNSKNTSSAQDDLFGSFDIVVDTAELSLPEQEEMSHAHLLSLEKEVLGIYVSGHPLKGLKKYFEKYGTPIRKIPQVVRMNATKERTLQGMITSLRKIITKKNATMAIVEMEDLSGKISVVFFPKTYEQFGNILKEDGFLKAKGKMEKREGEWQMLPSEAEVFSLDEIRKKAEIEGLLEETTAFLDLAEQEEEEFLEVFGENENGEMVQISEEFPPVGASIYGDQNHHTQEEEIPHPAAVPHPSPLPKGEGTKIWQISIQKHLTKEEMVLLKNFLETAKNGETEVVLLYHDKKIPFPKKIEKTEELERKIGGICN